MLKGNCEGFSCRCTPSCYGTRSCFEGGVRGGRVRKECAPRALIGSRDEALRNAEEAIELYLESLREHDEPIPPAIDEEIIEVAL